MKYWKIVGYSYRVQTYCTTCIIDALPTGEGEEFDGWTLEPTVHMSTEDNLTELAAAFGIDRMDERSFDSSYFPKVIFAGSVDDEYCDTCGSHLLD